MEATVFRYEKPDVAGKRKAVQFLARTDRATCVAQVLSCLSDSRARRAARDRRVAS